MENKNDCDSCQLPSQYFDSSKNSPFCKQCLSHQQEGLPSIRTPRFERSWASTIILKAKSEPPGLVMKKWAIPHKDASISCSSITTEAETVQSTACEAWKPIPQLDQSSRETTELPHLQPFLMSKKDTGTQTKQTRFKPFPLHIAVQPLVARCGLMLLETVTSKQ